MLFLVLHKPAAWSCALAGQVLGRRLLLDIELAGFDGTNRDVLDRYCEFGADPVHPRGNGACNFPVAAQRPRQDPGQYLINYKYERT